MISLLFSIALLPAGLNSEQGLEAPALPTLPPAPEGQVLDRMEWLTEDRRLTLETELTRIREEHSVDLFVVVWDRRLSDGQQPAELAQHIGESWSHGSIWGTVLLTPAAINQPIVVTGGQNLNEEHLTHLAQAAAYSVEFGAKAWTDQDRVKQTTLVLAEELVFAKYALAPRPKGLASSLSGGITSSSYSPILLAAVGTLGLFALLLALYFLIRRHKVDSPEPSAHHFPAPQTRPRLGAPWSGCSSLVVTIPPNPSP